MDMRAYSASAPAVGAGFQQPIPASFNPSQVNLKAPTRTSRAAQCEQNLRYGARKESNLPRHLASDAVKILP